MTSRELEILNSIYRSGGQCSMRMVSKETGLSSDYTFLISKELIKRNLVRKTAANIFVLTAGGRSVIERTKIEGKTPTLIEVSRNLGSRGEMPPFEPEISFISRRLAAGEPALTEHNLGKGQITEVADAKSIQRSIKRLTVVNRKRSNY